MFNQEQMGQFLKQGLKVNEAQQEAKSSGLTKIMEALNKEASKEKDKEAEG
ncbi:hypothetical protein [Niallia taxi]|uniref:hypothetical protein n=1 Tax=Niallia taxi TaxID=2499688 RepID=UPI0013E2D5AF|nr:hypothetical protein [Niallia taxi]